MANNCILCLLSCQAYKDLHCDRLGFLLENTYLHLNEKFEIFYNVMQSLKNITKYVVLCKRTYFTSNSVVFLRTLAARDTIIIMDAYTPVFAGMICIYRATIFVYWFCNWRITFSWCFKVIIMLFVWKAIRKIYI